MSGNDLVDFICCLGTVQAIAEVNAQAPPEKKKKEEPVATPVFGSELPMLALNMEREVSATIVEDGVKI